MFSGIVAEVGTVRDLGESWIDISATRSVARAATGSSIAVNGVCLTAVEVRADGFRADVMPETLRMSSLGSLTRGSRVNLEPALALGDELGGHLVQGHIDGVGRVVDVRQEGNARWVTVEVPPGISRHCVEKGSIAIDGTSLTIAAIEGDRVKLSLIPQTLELTVASDYRPGSVVNLEADVLAKYVARYLEGRNGNG